MAFGWITALKIIPWKDVIESAPHIVKAAKNLYAGAKANASNPSDAQSPPSDKSKTEVSEDSDLREIKVKVQQLRGEQESSVELIRSLAQQNVRIVEAIELLRVRTKILLITCVLLSGLLASLVYWLILD